MSLVNIGWLEENLDKVKIIDCSWHMPQTERNGFAEYKNKHIKNAIFFDLDKNSKKDTDLPHMLVNAKSWKNIVSNMGIKNDDQIVIYDNSDVISSCRCWYNFIYFGHNPESVHVLDGGLKKWIEEDKPTTSDIIKISPSDYTVHEKKELVKDINQVNKNIFENEFNIIDARSLERFEGKVPEPRKGLRSGSIKNSFCLPFSEIVNQDHTFISKKQIHEKFKSTGYEIDKNIVFTCGSGVTASVLALAYSLIDNKYMPTIYDGSWSEYGKN
ncbi:sulfurtransferase [Candidatus Pelagibacter giovannonii]|uniref:Sulfurtransferase n=1 Tax=Candidatus Pelagibacter giovannonii TaxID=2563896 RepID=A0A6H1Q2Q6_9PROT|nr:rhodanese-like domain-containing protein [Candidatus Pelagibacter giovannonii]QIZ21212.1 sulfurtransferase [Candidatus Pelagibacter giovannonii]